MENKELIEIDDCWESELPLEFLENDDSDSGKGIVDGKNIIARVSGPAFFPNKASRNNRFYPKKLWEVVLSDKEFLKRLKDRKIFGTIGHDLPLNEDSIREGNISHILSKMWINKKDVGMAEFLILNTNSGKELNTMLRAGSKLAVSTRARAYSKKDSTGVFQMVPGQYIFEGIDFVINPGYVDAIPQVIESTQVKKTIKIEKENRMSEENNANEIQALNQDIKEMKNEKAEELKEKNNVTSKNLAQYKELGTHKFVSEELKDLGAFREVVNTSKELGEFLEDFNTILVDIKEAHKTSDSFEEEIMEYRELGTIDRFAELKNGRSTEDEWLNEVLENAGELKKIGTIKDILEMNEEKEKLAQEFKVLQFERLEKEYGVSSSEISELCDKNEMTYLQVESILKSTKPSKAKYSTGKLNTRDLKNIPATEASNESVNYNDNSESLLDSLFTNRS